MEPRADSLGAFSFVANVRSPRKHQDLNRELQRERFSLTTLLEFMRMLTPDLGEQEILRSVLRTLMGRFLIKDSLAYLATDDGQYRLAARFGFTERELPVELDLPRLQALSNIAQVSQTLWLTTTDGADPLGLLMIGLPLIGTVPMVSESSYFESIATLTSIALTNAQLFEHERERERLESEMELARQIQTSMLPHQFPNIDGLEFAAAYQPTEWVGGDSYDLMRIDSHRVLFSIADVVGKGITAALTMSNMQSALRALHGLMMREHVSLVETVEELNRLIYSSTAPDRFVTAVIGIVDAERHTVELAVCGHPQPLVISEVGKTSTVKPTGIPLGVLEQFDFETVQLPFPVGTTLLVYTDGLSEAQHAGKFIGSVGVEKIVEILNFQRAPLQPSLDRVVGSEQLEVADDITLLAIRSTR